MKSYLLDIKIKAGLCDTYIAHPEGKDLPVVLFYMDAIGLRPRICEMAERLASAGYYVLVPNAYYRSRRAPVVDYEAFKGNFREIFMQVKELAGQLTPDLLQSDCADFLEFIKQQPLVDSRKIGAVGYCMGGGQALRSAGNFPDAFSAVASFHAGNLATEAETSPHHWFPRIKAEVYIGHADQDRHMPSEQIERVAQELRAAQLKYKAELYTGCLHGWTMKDLDVYNPAGEEKHWENMLDLFARNLQR